jgi:dUTP pyrophosphatase
MYEERFLQKELYMNFSMDIKKLNDKATLPVYSSEFAAGADLYSCLECEVTIAPGETKLIPTGLAMAIPEGLVGLIYARSGLASKKGLAPANKVGVIDAGYRGELCTALYNQSSCVRTVEPGERIAQLVIAPILHADFAEAEELSSTVRGAGGFGSTGTR